MNGFLTLAFLFFLGSLAGWCLEVVFRKFFSSSNPEHRWINPGFCTGPYLPIYGFGLCALYVLARMESRVDIANPFWRKVVMLLLMAAAMTAIEYIAGILCLKLAKVRLWDYSGQWGNVQGIICPLFSLFWGILGGGYYFFIHPKILGALQWLSRNLAFSFVIGFFFGVLFIDVAHSTQLVVKLRRWAKENHVVVHYEALKAQIRRRAEAERQKYHFFRPFRSDWPLREHLKSLGETLRQHIRKA